MRGTKIICIPGLSVNKEATLHQLMLSGTDAACLNFPRQPHAEQKVRSDMTKRLRQELGLPIALLFGTKGPRVCIRVFSTPQITLKQGQKFTLAIRKVDGTDEIASVTFANLPKDIDHSSHILTDDGLIELKVESYTDTDVLCTVLNGGTLFANEGMDVLGIQLSLPFISERDQSNTASVVQEDFDSIVASFMRSARDILKLRSELEKLNCHNMRITAKVESCENVDNIDEIIRVADGIMIARGDLGVEIPLEEIPIVQKHLIRKGYSGDTQVITATQMLDLMMKSSRLTRTEATDVASAVYDGTSAIMLSDETTAGEYPTESLKTMFIIAEHTERDIDYESRFAQLAGKESPNIISAISHAICTTAHGLGAVVIITVSKSGRITRMVSKYRPACLVISGTTGETVRHQMNLSWGVIPIMVEEQTNADKLFDRVVRVSRDRDLVKDGDVVVITAGVPVGFSSTTNLLKVQVVGDILVSGRGVNQGYTYDNLYVCQTEEEAQQRFEPGGVLVLPHTTNKLMELICLSAAITAEQDGPNSHAVIARIILNKPVIVDTENTTQLLKSGTIVTVDTMHGIMYSGIHKQEK